MAGFAGLKDISSNPLSLIGIVIAIILITRMAVIGLPLIITEFASLAGLGNFSFAGLFADDGVGEIIISAIVLVAVLAIMGVRGLAGRSRR